MTTIEESSGNIYADLGFGDADEMLVKAQLARQITITINERQWTQSDACQVLELIQPKLSNLFNGKFRGISESKMLECLTRLGRDVQIVIGADTHPKTPGRVSIVGS
jgi:predicted XRE-type DNA-binding protein